MQNKSVVLLHVKEFYRPNKTPVSEKTDLKWKYDTENFGCCSMAHCCGCFYYSVATLSLPLLEWQMIPIKDMTLVAVSLVCYLIPIKVFIMLLSTVTATPPFCFFLMFHYRMWSTSRRNITIAGASGILKQLLCDEQKCDKTDCGLLFENSQYLQLYFQFQPEHFTRCSNICKGSGGLIIVVFCVQSESM